MTGLWALLKKDFGSYFRSWVGVLGLAVFLLLAGVFFTLIVLSYAQLSLESARQAYEGIEALSLTGFIFGAFFLNLGVLFLFLAPLLTMRSLAEEKKMATLELLYTYPLSDFQIVGGKYLALLSQMALLFLPTLTCVGLMFFLKVNLDVGVVVGGSLGFFLLGASFLAVGLFFSSMTESQLLAGALTFAALFFLWMFEWLVGFLPHPWNEGLARLSPFFHFRDFSLGVIDLSDGVYFVCFVAFFFFLTLRRVEARNWKG